MLRRLIILAVLALVAPAQARLIENEVELVQRFGSVVSRSPVDRSFRGLSYRLGEQLNFRSAHWRISAMMIDGLCRQITYGNSGVWTEDQIIDLLDRNGGRNAYTEEGVGPDNSRRQWTHVAGISAAFSGGVLEITHPLVGRRLAMLKANAEAETPPRMTSFERRAQRVEEFMNSPGYTIPVVTLLLLAPFIVARFDREAGTSLWKQTLHNYGLVAAIGGLIGLITWPNAVGKTIEFWGPILKDSHRMRLLACLLCVGCAFGLYRIKKTWRGFFGVMEVMGGVVTCYQTFLQKFENPFIYAVTLGAGVFLITQGMENLFPPKPAPPSQGESRTADSALVDPVHGAPNEITPHRRRSRRGR